MKNRLYIPLFFLLVASSLLQAQGIRKYAGEFMAIDVSARAQALGGAFTAMSNDVYASFYNPAGLVQIDGLQVGFTHTQQFLSSINYDYLGVARPFSQNGVVGLSVIRLGVDNIKDSRAAAILDDNGGLLGIDESQIENFNTSDYVALLSLGQRVGARWSWGVNLKMIRRNLTDENSANGVGLDAGVFMAVNHQWRVSAMLRNATTTLITWQTGEKELVSPTLRIGTSYRVQLPGNNSYFTPLFDVVVQSESTTNLTENSLGGGLLGGALGGELSYQEKLFIRGGYDDLQRLNLGVGIAIPHIGIDYAFTSYDQELGNAHRIGILIDFNK